LSLRVFILIWLITGVLVWFGGRAGSWHIGASGVIYGIGTFLFFSGVIRNYIPLMAISLIVVFLYGSLFWGMIPVKWDLPYSWEAHLYGSITGLILALIYRDKGPQRPEPDWAEDEEEDENEDDENAYWKTNIS
jgi:membrane associated rhomboid family serine protease